MKINIPKVVIPVSLAEYAPELQGKFLHVWVNQPRERLREYDDLVTEMQERSMAEARKSVESQTSKVVPQGDDKGQEGRTSTVMEKVFDQIRAMLRFKRERKADGIDVKLLKWYAEMWSQGPDDTKWTVDELQELEAQDPAFLSWCIARSWNERLEHMQRKKKA